MKCEYCGKRFRKHTKNGLGAFLKHMKLHKGFERQEKAFTKFSWVFHREGKRDYATLCTGLAEVCRMLNKEEA